MNLNLIARQLQRESAQQLEAQQRLVNATVNAEQKTYASSTVYGQALLKKNIELVSERISSRLHLIRRGTAAVDAAIVNNHLKCADPKVLALITIKKCFDVLGKEPKPQLVDISVAVGRAVETELRLSFYFSKDSSLFKDIQRRFHSSTGTNQKATVYKIQFNKAGIQWKTWSQVNAHKIGCWLLDGLMGATGWITKDTIPVGKKRHRTVMRYSREFLGLKEAILARAESLAFCQWPMVCPPNDWSNTDRGGYLTEMVRQQTPMVRSWSSHTVNQGEIPIQMLNNLQQTEYRINRQVLEVAQWAFDSFFSIGKFKRETQRTPPPYPREGASEDEIKAYKRHRREIEDFNAQLEQKNWRTAEVMYVANKYVNEQRFWIPWSFDYRGRVYPLVTALSPQGTDFDKALLYFYDEGPVDEYWLAFHVATTYGLDKATMEERVEWTRNNHDLITRIALNPIDYRSEWIHSSEPWCFLASCFDYHACCITKERNSSGLPVGIDATCSGLQHLSALTLDGGAASLVNVTPTDKPADGYKTVALTSLKYINDQAVHPYINRKTTKRTVMTTPYGVSRDSARGYIRAQLMEDGCDLSVAGRLRDITTAIFELAVPEVFAGPVEVMKWLQKSARQVLETQEHIEWKSPSGFIVRQDLRSCITERIQTHLMGRVCTHITVGRGDPDPKHHVSALAPNVVHSMDAALLHLTFCYWNKPFTVIHDCILGRSCDMQEMASDIRLHFAEMYKFPVLEDWAAQVGVSEPAGLIKNTLDIESVNQSLYFFC